MCVCVCVLVLGIFGSGINKSMQTEQERIESSLEPGKWDEFWEAIDPDLPDLEDDETAKQTPTTDPTNQTPAAAEALPHELQDKKNH